LDDRSSCPRTSPSQLTPTEMANIKDMVLAPENRHMVLGTLALYIQRIGKVFASATTWAKLVRERGWLRPRLRVYPAKPTDPNESTASVLIRDMDRIRRCPLRHIREWVPDAQNAASVPFKSGNESA
jgi:hypothetical protein